jgi:hypothetical protein
MDTSARKPDLSDIAIWAALALAMLAAVSDPRSRNLVRASADSCSKSEAVAVAPGPRDGAIERDMERYKSGVF